MGTHELLKFFGFCIRQGYWIAGFGTSHGVSPPAPVYPFFLALSNSERTCGTLYLEQFCTTLIEPLTDLVYAMNRFEDRDLSDLALLTLGPTLQGGRNNVCLLYTSDAAD